MTKTVVRISELGVDDGMHYYTIVDNDDVVERGTMRTRLDVEKGRLSLYWNGLERHFESDVEAELSINSATNAKVGFKLVDEDKKIIVYFMNEK
jgi:hypothetical protein